MPNDSIALAEPEVVPTANLAAPSQPPEPKPAEADAVVVASGNPKTTPEDGEGHELVHQDTNAGKVVEEHGSSAERKGEQQQRPPRRNSVVSQNKVHSEEASPKKSKKSRNPPYTSKRARLSKCANYC